jgi:ribonuclease HII
MAWIIGIDEAGYGPNLGPFVMTAVACRVPDDLGHTNLWQLLNAVVRQAAEPDDGRILVDDSKLVFSTARGVGELERGVLALLVRDAGSMTLHNFLESIAPDDLRELHGEPWYTGASGIPSDETATDFAPVNAHVDQTCTTAGIAFRLLRSVVVCPARFNAVVDEHGSKGAVLGEALRRLVRCCRDSIPGDERLSFYVDKHGGRNTYAAQLQHALAEGVVVVRQEGMRRSVYEVLGLQREMHFQFQPRADSEHFCVALASMTSKYLRELLMGEFNRYWEMHVPGVKPTAGYPGDAARFLKDITPAVQRLGISETALWRRK